MSLKAMAVSVLMLVLIAPIQAQECRSLPEIQQSLLPPGRLPEGDHWIRADRERPVFFAVPGKVDERRHFAGSVCIPDGTPIPNLELRLVLYEGERPEGEADLRLQHLQQGPLEIQEEWQLRTDSAGRFRRAELRAGKYALLPADWTGLQTPALIFDFQLLPGTSLFEPSR